MPEMIVRIDSLCVMSDMDWMDCMTAGGLRFFRNLRNRVSQVNLPICLS
jgi:hypothetical protein